MKKILLVLSFAIVFTVSLFANDDFIKAAKNGDIAEVRKYINRGVDIDAKDEYSMNALLYAICEGHTKIVELLIDKGADINATDNSGITALMFACYHGHIEIVKLLIAAGVDINAKDNEGDTVLMHNCRRIDYSSVLELLVNFGADINAKNNKGISAYKEAYGKYHTATYLLLEKLGADTK